MVIDVPKAHVISSRGLRSSNVMATFLRIQSSSQPSITSYHVIAYYFTVSSPTYQHQSPQWHCTNSFHCQQLCPQSKDSAVHQNEHRILTHQKLHSLQFNPILPLCIYRPSLNSILNRIYGNSRLMNQIYPLRNILILYYIHMLIIL